MTQVFTPPRLWGIAARTKNAVCIEYTAFARLLNSVSDIILRQMILWAAEAISVKPIRLKMWLPGFIVIDFGRCVRTVAWSVRELEGRRLR